VIVASYLHQRMLSVRITTVKLSVPVLLSLV
jgi:hypothetical protein